MAEMRVVVGVEITDTNGDRFTHQIVKNVATGGNPLYFEKDFYAGVIGLAGDVRSDVVARFGELN